MGTQIYIDESEKAERLLKITENLNHIKDIDALLDKILLESRKITNADAGSIFLKDEDKLKFSYVQNDSLFKGDLKNNKYLYVNQELNINENSIAGYVAKKSEALMIDDVYRLNSNVPYAFNQSFDKNSGYKTKSILAVPLKTSDGDVVGVIQIINALDDKCNPIEFSDKDKSYITYFANNAAIAIEKAKMTRAIILRMIMMAELRDPNETGQHVNRVGAYSIELYQRWAAKRGISKDVIKKSIDILRLASMLHDVGKVAISDKILKKPARLTYEEYEAMKLHTIFGANLFKNTTSDFDIASAEICLTHHERWDGNGYPGGFDSIDGDHGVSETGKRGDDIPIFSRIVAVADVYDALMSKRVYKEPWSEERVLDYMKEQAGKQFDPEVISSLFSSYDVIKAIREKFSD